MDQLPSLTIAIPTFERHSAASARIKSILESGNNDQIKILIIDNASADNTAERLRDSYKNEENLEVLRNNENIGYARNFLSIFSKCRTDYVLLCSDEDDVICKELPKFLRFLAESLPVYVSPVALIEGASYRGRKRIEPIKPEEYQEASFYISGLTYRVNRRIIELAGEIEKILDCNSAANMYPQSILAARLILEDNCFWYPAPITSKAEQLPSHLAEIDGEPYYGVVGRYRQQVGRIQYFRGLLKEYPSKKNILEAMIKADSRKMFHSIRSGLAMANPDLLAYFDQEAYDATKRDIVRRMIPLRLVRPAIARARKLILFLRQLITS